MWYKNAIIFHLKLHIEHHPTSYNPFSHVRRLNYQQNNKNHFPLKFVVRSSCCRLVCDSTGSWSLEIQLVLAPVGLANSSYLALCSTWYDNLWDKNQLKIDRPLLQDNSHWLIAEGRSNKTDRLHTSFASIYHYLVQTNDPKIPVSCRFHHFWVVELPLNNWKWFCDLTNNYIHTWSKGHIL